MTENSEYKNSEIGRIPVDWDTKRLDDLSIKIFVGRDPKGGKRVHSDFPTECRLIRSGNVFDGLLKISDTAFISESIKDEITSAEVKENDVLLNQLGDGITFARSCVVPKEVLPAYITRSVGCIRVDEDVLLPHYLNAYLILDNTKKYIESFDSGSSRRAIDGGKMKKFVIPLAPLVEQEHIGDFHKITEKKIEINKKINNLLEKISLEIFKKWFIHFDYPNKISQKGNRREIPELHSDSIPTGWEYVAFSDIANIILGGTPKRNVPEYWKGNIKWASARDISRTDDLYLIDTDEKITKSGLNNSNTKLLPQETIVITARGTVGEIRLLGDNITFNQTCYGILAKEEMSQFFVYMLLKASIGQMKALSYGTIFDTITINTFKELKVIKPPLHLIQKYDQFVQPFFDLILENTKQSTILANMKKICLPRLMSGKIRFKTRDHT